MPCKPSPAALVPAVAPGPDGVPARLGDHWWHCCGTQGPQPHCSWGGGWLPGPRPLGDPQGHCHRHCHSTSPGAAQRPVDVAPSQAGPPVPPQHWGGTGLLPPRPHMPAPLDPALIVPSGTSPLLVGRFQSSDRAALWTTGGTPTPTRDPIPLPAWRVQGNTRLYGSFYFYFQILGRSLDPPSPHQHMGRGPMAATPWGGLAHGALPQRSLQRASKREQPPRPPEPPRWGAARARGAAAPAGGYMTS